MHGKGKFVFYQGGALMALWLVRAGRQGERENLALEGEFSHSKELRFPVVQIKCLRSSPPG